MKKKQDLNKNEKKEWRSKPELFVLSMTKTKNTEGTVDDGDLSLMQGS